MKHTAVDQLRDRLLKEFGFAYSDNIHEELKAIEKEQIESAYKAGYNYCAWDRSCDSEKYYTETYNNTQS
jgi:hypothetical protein